MATSKLASVLAIMAEIREERKRQDNQWGGAGHDDQHTSADWASYRGKFENRQLRRDRDGDFGLQRADLIKIAALAIAQVESMDRQIARRQLDLGPVNV